MEKSRFTYIKIPEKQLTWVENGKMCVFTKGNLSTQHTRMYAYTHREYVKIRLDDKRVGERSRGKGNKWRY